MTKRRQSHPVSVLDVAAYILANHSRNTPILAWKMHKLAYFCQVQQLIREGVTMFHEKILATPKGVIIEELRALHYHQWCVGDCSIGNINHLSLKQVDVIGEVMKKYGDKTTEELDELIQSAFPWEKATQAADHHKEGEIEITPSIMQLSLS